MTSLQRRAVFAGAAWGLISVLIGSLALLTFLNAMAYRRFDAALLDRHTQVVVALANNVGRIETIDRVLSDPAYSQAYSGRYWQVAQEGGETIGSRSLFDAVLPANAAPGGEPVVWEAEGPNSRVRGLSQTIEVEEGGVWTVSVAESLEALNAELGEVRRNVLLSLGFVGALGAMGALVLTAMLLRPIRKLRSDVTRRWNAGTRLDATQYPDEVAPLVTDINALMERNRGIVDRARQYAADMAHALKTPSAILRNELEAMPDAYNAGRALEALDRIDAQIVRSLARMRTANTASSEGAASSVTGSVERLARLFRSMPENAETDLHIDVPEGLTVAMDRLDFEETLGNILDNAFKWTATTVHIAAVPERDQVTIRVEDDGPGIAEDQRGDALRSGYRLDTSVAGNGLGLPIARDLLETCGGSLELDRSETLNGLAVRMRLPASFAPGRRTVGTGPETTDRS